MSTPSSQRKRHPTSLPADKRRNIRFSETEKPLRQDVHELGGLIGAMVKDRGGEALFNTVEAARSLAIARRNGDADADAGLEAFLGGLDYMQAHDVSRAFFDLVSGHQHRGAASPGAPPPGLFVRRKPAAARRPGGGFSAIAPGRHGPGSGCGDSQYDPAEPGLYRAPHGADPTAVLRQQGEIASLLEQRYNSARVPRQVNALLRAMQEKITAIWHCEEHPHEETTVAAEVQQLLFFVTKVIYPAAPDFYDSLTEAMTIAFGERARDVHIASLLRFHSSIGGDLEADAEITPRSIRQLFDTQRLAVLNLYRNECLELAETLTHSARRMDPGGEIGRRIRVYREHFPDVYAELGPDQRDMPYRVLLLLMAARLQATALDTAFHYDDEHELLDDLEVLAHSLADHGGAFAGSQGVQRLVRRVETFGFYLLSVEVRQRAVMMRRVLGKAFGQRQWETPAARLKSLRQALERDLVRPEDLGNEGLRALGLFDALRYLRGRYGRHALGGLLLGGVREPADVLGALLLARWAGFERADGHTPIDLIPVFESDMDARQCARVIEQLLGEPAYRRHLKNRKNQQLVMVDHDPVRRDFDLPTEQWSIRGLQKAAVRAVRDSDIAPVLLQARGSAYERSGRRSLLANIPPEQFQRPFKYAEAGERAGLRYGMQGIALRSLELAAGELLLAKAHKGRARAPREAEEMMACLVLGSGEAHNDFPGGPRGMADYFELATPADLLARMPTTARRSGMREGTAVELPRALVSFCWAQSRNLLPGWYGFGSGLQRAIGEYGLKAVRKYAAAWPYFHGLLRDPRTGAGPLGPGNCRGLFATCRRSARSLFRRDTEGARADSGESAPRVREESPA